MEERILLLDCLRACVAETNGGLFCCGSVLQGGFDLNIRRQGSPSGMQNSGFGIEELLNFAPILSGDEVGADVPTPW